MSMKRVSKNLFLTAGDIAVAVNVRAVLFDTVAPYMYINIDVLEDDGTTHFALQRYVTKATHIVQKQLINTIC